jgi:hypothetical protein
MTEKKIRSKFTPRIEATMRAMMEKAKDSKKNGLTCTGMSGGKEMAGIERRWAHFGVTSVLSFPVVI